MIKKDSEEISSPCVSICALNADDICVGCYRTGDEITRWWAMENSEKQQTLDKVKERETQSYI
ncbi:MAG: putative Fe-S protein YdhL (DUF1289 family) [Pseudohongiellaceae bacterium]|jgi:predicted Fe-S protein YdhL (DUF1289 family)